MKKWVVVLLFLIVSKAGIAQKDNDSIAYKMPVVNGKLVYEDSVEVKGTSKARLDSVAKKWLGTYFKYYQRDTLSKDGDLNSSVLSFALLEFRAPPNSLRVVYYDYYLKITIKIDCKDNRYSYKIYDTWFRPKSGFFNKVVQHPTDADYLIDIYKRKKYGIWSMDGSTIRYYLSCVNTSIVNCIASLNKAIAN